MRIVIEALDAQNSRSMFRAALNGKPIGDLLTAAQAHLLTGDALEMFILGGGSKRRRNNAPANDDANLSHADPDGIA